MAKLQHIKKTVEQGYTSWSAPELRNARVWKLYGSWTLTIARVDLLWVLPHGNNARTLRQLDEYIEKILRMSDHELVEKVFWAKTKALDCMNRDDMFDKFKCQTSRMWNERADTLMVLYRDRVGQFVDGQVSLAAE